MDFTIYYADGTIYSGNPYEAPAVGVIVITQPCPIQGWRTVQGNDYFVLWEWGWESVDINGLWDYLSQPGPSCVKFGRTILTEKYQEIMGRAVAEAPEIYR